MMRDGFLPILDLAQFAAKINNHQPGASSLCISEAGRAAVDPATFTAPPYRVFNNPDAAPCAALYRATPMNGAAHFSNEVAA